MLRPAATLLLLSLALIQAAAANTAAFPGSDTFRKLQLQTLACARENTAASCEEARRQANPLIDHPRLPAACKDTLWAIVQQAQPAARNSFERRENLNRQAQEVTLVCRQTIRPAEKPAAAPASGNPGSGAGGGFGFGSPGR